MFQGESTWSLISCIMSYIASRSTDPLNAIADSGIATISKIKNHFMKLT